jgi:hypothetical protein
MDEEGLPEAVLLFIRAHINSVEQLETLLLLRSTRDREWTALQLSQELRTAADSASERLVDLESRGLLSKPRPSPPTYRYAPRTPALERTVNALAGAYAERRYTVINLIFSKPVDKIRVFADAFRLRRKEGDDREGGDDD